MTCKPLCWLFLCRTKFLLPVFQRVYEWKKTPTTYLLQHFCLLLSLSMLSSVSLMACVPDCCLWLPLKSVWKYESVSMHLNVALDLLLLWPWMFLKWLIDTFPVWQWYQSMDIHQPFSFLKVIQPTVGCVFGLIGSGVRFADLWED